jgi:NDP-sugar pyrophosphorylase family protein
MTRDEAREFAKVVQAYADGKQVQAHLKEGRWIDLDDPEFFSQPKGYYRIKPEPREYWLRALPDGRIAVFTEKDQAEIEASFWQHSKVIHVREVMP